MVTRNVAPTPYRATAGPALPERDIVFMTDINQLGFINADGSGYMAYTVDMSKWPDQNSGFVPSLYDMVTWSPDGRFLTGRYTVSHRSGGLPILLSTAGQLLGCPIELSPYATNRVWAITDTTVIAVDANDKTSRVVAFDISSCTITNTVYSSEGGIGETTISTKGWLAISKGGVLIISAGHTLTVTIPNANFPAWSPSGELIAYSIIGDGLYVANKDGSAPRKLVDDSDPHSLNVSSWSPDEKWLVYDRRISVGDQITSVIYKVNVMTGESYELFRGGYRPNWRWTIPAPEK
jgi:hypothetical protein